MALIKEHYFEGNIYNYWDIIEITYPNKNTLISVALFPSAEAQKENQNEYLTVKYVTLTGEWLNDDKIYQAIINENEFFKNAIII